MNFIHYQRIVTVVDRDGQNPIQSPFDTLILSPTVSMIISLNLSLRVTRMATIISLRKVIFFTPLTRHCPLCESSSFLFFFLSEELIPMIFNLNLSFDDTV